MLSLSNTAFASVCGGLSKKELDQPELEEGTHIEKEIQVVINKSPKEVKIWFDNIAPEKVIKGTEDVSGIAATCPYSDIEWGKVGSRRIVYKESGSTFLETILENRPQEYFHYMMWDFSKDLTHAIKYADAYFEVEQIDEHSSILRWHIAFRPNSFIYIFPISIYVKTSFYPFMKQSLEDIKQYIESY